MPLNLLKTYNEHLDIIGMGEAQRKRSLKGVFDRDFEHDLFFLGKQVTPTPANGTISMDTLFSHLTTVIEDKSTRSRIFDIVRSLRLHWVRYHIENCEENGLLVFSVQEPEGVRTYIYDQPEKYVIILEPKKSNGTYFLLTAYHLTGKDEKRDKIMKKYKRRLDEIQ